VGSLSRRIYIRTNFAWYILDRPAPQYEWLYKSFYVSVATLHHLLMEPEDISTNYAEFVRKLFQDHAIKRILREPLDVADIEDEEIVCYLSSDSLITGLSSWLM
jgi:hypothetical protein